MPLHGPKFAFGRLNLLVSGAMSKSDLIHQTLNRSETVSHRDFEWGYFNVSSVIHNNERFICGYLVKVRPTEQDLIVDRATHKIATEELLDRVEAKCDFILHLGTDVIAIRPIPNKVSVEQFFDRFAQVFEEANDKLFVSAEIKSIQDELEFRDALRKFSRIQRVSVSLHPSNPSSRALWRDTDERLRRMRASQFREHYESASEGGLLIEDNDAVFGDMMMAVDGYGEAKVEGTFEGKNRVVSTITRPISKKLSFMPDAPGDAIPELFDEYRAIWDRILK